MASLLGSTRAQAQGMDPTPERLVLQPPGLPSGVTCQSIAANPTAAIKAGFSPLSDYACRPDNVAFKNLVSELGSALAPSTMHGARTVGFGGFVLSLEAAYTHINSNDSTHANPATGYQGGVQYWHLGTQGSTDANGNYSTQDNSPDSLIGVYSLMVRKGLPFGFELDGALGYVQNTSLWTIGADVRWAILEGFRTGPMGYIPDIAIGGGVRTVTGSSKMYLTTVGIDAELSKPFTLSDSGVITPYLGYQHLIIYGNSAVLDATPNVNAVQQCGETGRNPTTGAPVCSNNVPGTNQPNDNDFNNNITFNPVQLNRERGFLGVTYRYELLYLGAQFLFDLVPPSSIDPDLDSTIQWTISLQAGVFF
ncbi:MAG: hypothetical protein ACLQVI_31965 [Polyangiaceae bacterium]